MTGTDRAAPHAQLDAELSLLWRRLRQMALALAREVEDGLDPAAYGLLGALYDSDGDVRGGDLAEKFGLDKSTVSRQIAQMEELALIQRVPDPQDGRARLVRITESGRSRVMRLREQRGQWLAQALRDWPHDDIDRLVELLARLNATMESPGQ